MKPTPTSNLRDADVIPSAETAVWQQPHLVFEVDGYPYACPIAGIQHLLCVVDAHTSDRRADAPAWETGRLTLNDHTSEIPIVSLRALWGLSELAANRQREALLVVNLDGQRVALRVDACVCVLSRLPAMSTGFALPAALKGNRGSGLSVAVPWRQSLLVTLELPALLPLDRTNPSLTP